MIQYDLKLRAGSIYVMEHKDNGRYVLHRDAALLEKQVDYDRGRIAELSAQLAEVTRERDTLKAMVDLHDALNDRRRAQAALQGADRRARYDR